MTNTDETMPQTDRNPLLVRLVWFLPVLILASCQRESTFSLTLITHSNSISDVRVVTSGHGFTYDRLTQSNPIHLGPVRGPIPKDFKLSWTTSQGTQRTCTITIKDIYPDDFDFTKDGYRIHIEDNGASLTFLVHGQTRFASEVGRVACCP